MSCTLTQASLGSPVGWMGHAGQHAIDHEHQASPGVPVLQDAMLLCCSSVYSSMPKPCWPSSPRIRGHAKAAQAYANFVGKVQVVGSIMCDHSKRACMVPISWGQAPTTLAWQRSMMGLPTGVAWPCLGQNSTYVLMRAM